MTNLYSVDIDYSEHKLEPIWMALIHRDGVDLPIAVLQDERLEPLLASIEMVITYDSRGM